MSLLTIMLVRAIHVIMHTNSLLSFVLLDGRTLVNIPCLLIHAIPYEHMHSLQWGYYKQCCSEHPCLCLLITCEQISLVEIPGSAIAGTQGGISSPLLENATLCFQIPTSIRWEMLLSCILSDICIFTVYPCGGFIYIIIPWRLMRHTPFQTLAILFPKTISHTHAHTCISVCIRLVQIPLSDQNILRFMFLFSQQIQGKLIFLV